MGALLQGSLAYLIPAIEEKMYEQVGEWCEATSKAVDSFQEYHSISKEKEGIVDEKFWEMLSEEVKKKEAKETQRKAKREEDQRKANEVKKLKKEAQDRRRPGSQRAGGVIAEKS